MTNKQLTCYAKLLYGIEYLGRYCAHCSFDGFTNPWVMDFHHTNPSNKKFNVKNKLISSEFDKLKNELDKCIILCCMCHRTLHSKLKEFDEYKIQIISKLEKIKNNDGRTTKNKKLTCNQRDDIIRLVEQGFSIKEISNLTSLKYDTVKGTLRNNFQKATRKSKKTYLPKSEIIVLYKTHKNSVRFIARKFNISPDCITQLLLENNISIREKKILDVNHIKQLIEQNLSNYEIAKQVGCSPQSVYRLRNREKI